MIKTLRRTPKITPLPSFESTPIRKYKGWAYDTYGLGKPPSVLQRLKNTVQRTMYDIPILNLGNKKWDNWPDPEPTIAEKLKDYLAPLVDVGSISGLIKAAGSKLPLIIGIAAMAGIIYLTYKIWEAHQSGDLDKIKKSISDAYNEIMSDLKKRAKDLFTIPGWVDSIGSQVMEALESQDPSTTISRLSDIVHSVVSQQKTIGPVQGSGLLRNIYRRHARVTRYHKGSGAMMPIF